MEPTTPGHSRGYYATRTAARAATYAAITAVFFTLPGLIEAAAKGLGL